jgi:outer membrane protein assembly factor BamB
LYFLDEKPPEPKPAQMFLGGSVSPIKEAVHYTALRAIDPGTSKVQWEYRRPPHSTYSGGMGGILATAGGLLFTSETSKLLVLDAHTGKLLASFETGGAIGSAAVSYRSNGRQYIAIAAGDVLLAFGLPDADVLRDD